MSSCHCFNVAHENAHFFFFQATSGVEGIGPVGERHSSYIFRIMGGTRRVLKLAKLKTKL